MPASNQYEYCRCASCVTAGGPNGLSQTSRTAKQHKANDAWPLVARADPGLLNTQATNKLSTSGPSARGDLEFTDNIFEYGNEISDLGTSDGGNSPNPGPDFSSDSDTEDFHLVPDHESPLSSDEGEVDEPVRDAEDRAAVEDLDHDDLFITNSSLFDTYRPGSPSEKDEELEEPEGVPQGLTAHPSIRNALIRAVTSSYFHGSTHVAVQHMLEGSALLLRSAERSSSGLHYRGLETMARTLATAEKHLGLSLEGFITYYFLCPTCWELHHPSELYKLDSPACGQPECSGLLYSVKRTHDCSEKRRPKLTMPYVEPEKAVQRMLLQPGKLAQINEWRGQGDEVGKAPPAVARGYDAFPDPTQPIRDVCDGWEWRAIQAGLERRRTGKWTVEDVDVREVHQRFVSLPCGLVWQMNIDW
jgi:hypothetical protein